MIPTIRHLAAIAALALVATSSAAEAKPAVCKTVKCVNCQKACETSYYKKVNGPNFNPSTSGIFKRQYYACRAACLK